MYSLIYCFIRLILCPNYFARSSLADSSSIHIHLLLRICLGYLGSVEAGKEYDATELVKSYSGPKPNILIDQVYSKPRLWPNIFFITSLVFCVFLYVLSPVISSCGVLPVTKDEIHVKITQKKQDLV